MNVQQLIQDIKKQNVNYLTKLENEAQYNYAISQDKDIALSWLKATLDLLDKAGYIVRASVNYEAGVQVDNVVSLRKRV